MRPLLTLLAFTSLAACRCDGGPATGECTGTWGGVAISAAMDPDSAVVTTYAPTCPAIGVDVYVVRYGTGQVKFDVEPTTKPAVITGEVTAFVPDNTKAFSFEPTVTGQSGTLKLKVEGLYLRHTGSLVMTAGAETLTCTFNLPRITEGSRPYCGGGGDGD